MWPRPRARGPRGRRDAWARALAALLAAGALAPRTTPAEPVPAVDWQAARPDFSWSFPRDHAAHPGYRNEWWYFTGHLRGQDGRRLAYQLTFFRVGLLPAAPGLNSAWAAPGLIMGHAAILDADAGKHWFSEVLYRQAPFLAGLGSVPGRVVWSRGPAGTGADWHLAWRGREFELSMADERQGLALDLIARPAKPVVLHGEAGYSRKGKVPDAASLYYSFTRLQTTGTLATPAGTWEVAGESWMDREFSSQQLAPGQVGWDWFSLQLDDGREIMLYLMRTAGGEIDHRSGTLVDAAGAARELTADEWSVRAETGWRSPVTGARYPAGWTVNLPDAGLTLKVTPLLPDQENRSALAGGLFYWEGAVALRDPKGRSVGRGFVELTGYGENNRPPL